MGGLREEFPERDGCPGMRWERLWVLLPIESRTFHNRTWGWDREHLLVGSEWTSLGFQGHNILGFSWSPGLEEQQEDNFSPVCCRRDRRSTSWGRQKRQEETWRDPEIAATRATFRSRPQVIRKLLLKCIFFFTWVPLIYQQSQHKLNDPFLPEDQGPKGVGHWTSLY